MGLKRKRSFDSSPASTTSFSSTRASQSPTPLSRSFNEVSSMDVDRPISSFPMATWNMGTGRLSSTDLGSRTRKRFRDNRPDAETIHENTLHKLFSAQKQHPFASPVLSQEPPAQKHPPTQKSTLHSFWAIRKPAPPPTVVVHAPEFEDPDRPRCEDCGHDLQASDGMDVDMGGCCAPSPFACSSCGKSVCDMCAVVANERNCLHCTSVKGSHGAF